MSSNPKELLKQIMELEFTLVELNLFLDTHPNCTQALKNFNQTNNRLRQLINVYEKKYGPITLFSEDCALDSWKWIEEPWPWEINY